MAGSSPAGADHNEDIPVVANPDLGDACGLDFVLILDRSGSIAQADAGTLVKDAGKAFLDALEGTGSTASLVTFANDADDAARNVTPRLLTQASIDADFDPAINGMVFSGATNWEDALGEARAQFPTFPNLRPDLVVMVTDGNPTTHNGDDSNSGSVTDPNDIDNAVTQANLIKSPPGSHMFAVGVGGTEAAPLDAHNMQAISGTDEFDGTPLSDIHTADWTKVESFEELQSRLVAAATALCSGTVKVQKELDGTPAADWTFNATGPGETQTGTTDADGMTAFAYPFESAEDDSIATTISEEPQADITLAGASCLDADGEPAGTFTEGAMQLTVGPAETISCVFDNRTELAPGIDIAKSGPAQAHEGDVVTYTFVVTNTGDAPLSDVVVSDDVLGEIGTVASLEPGASETFEKIFTMPVQSADVVNTAEACGTDAGDVSICDEATHSTDLLHPAMSLVKTADPTAVTVSGDVVYTYVVTNTGDIVLSGVNVDDDLLGLIGSPGTLTPGQSATVTGTGTVGPTTAASVTNIGTAKGTDPLNREVTVTDDAVVTVDAADVVAQVLPDTDVLGVAVADVPAELPRTGTGALSPLLAGIGLLVAGMTIIATSRNRRRTTSS